MASCLQDLEPATVTAEDARVLLEFGVEVEHFGASLKLRVASQAVRGVPWQEEGHRSEAGWLAEATRTSVPEAISALATSERLAELPATAEALRDGIVSPTEAKAVCAAATADPTLEAELLAAAPTMPVSVLCRHARNLATAAHDHDPDHRRKVHSRRYLRFWTDAEGMFRLSGGLTADAGVELLTAVRSRAVHVFDDALRARIPESQAAYDADALVALATGDDRRATFSGPEGGGSRRVRIVLHVSLEALRRGALEDGELCEVPGVGPVPLAMAQGLMGEAILSCVITDGVAVSAVAHLGRAVPTHVLTALEARDRMCVVPECTVSLGLEVDHWQVPFAQDGPSELWNLARICRFHHRLKTYDGYSLAGGPGKWEWQPPN